METDTGKQMEEQPIQCICGYQAADEHDFDDHLIAMSHADDAGPHGAR